MAPGWFPHNREYTCNSTTYRTLSHIDLVYTSSDALCWTREAQHLPWAISNHAPLSLTIVISPLAYGCGACPGFGYLMIGYSSWWWKLFVITGSWMRILPMLGYCRMHLNPGLEGSMSPASLPCRGRLLGPWRLWRGRLADERWSILSPRPMMIIWSGRRLWGSYPCIMLSRLRNLCCTPFKGSLNKGIKKGRLLAWLSRGPLI